MKCLIHFASYICRFKFSFNEAVYCFFTVLHNYKSSRSLYNTNNFCIVKNANCFGLATITQLPKRFRFNPQTLFIFSGSNFYVFNRNIFLLQFISSAIGFSVRQSSCKSCFNISFSANFYFFGKPKLRIVKTDGSFICKNFTKIKDAFSFHKR